MRILALDVSSKSSGFALIVDGKIIPDGYGCICPDKKDCLGARLVFFQNEINRLIDLYSPDDIIIEDIFKGFSVIAFKVLAQFRGVAIKTIFEKTGRDPHCILAIEARSILKIRMKKEDAFKDATKKFKIKGFDFERDNDIVDAICLGMALYKMKESAYEKPIKNSGRKRKKKRNKKTSS